MIRSIRAFIHFVIKVIQVIVTLLLLAVGLYLYARYIEPRLLMVEEKRLSSTYLDGQEAPLRIIQFSDVHLGAYYSESAFQDLVLKINSYSPDLVVFTGDLLDEGGKYKKGQQVAKLLESIQTTYGKFAVYGNHDHGANGSKLYKEIMEQGGFTLLKNSDVVISLPSQKKIRLIGVDDYLLGNPDLEKAFAHIKPNQYNIFLSHVPDCADKVSQYPIDLQLSGHSHGGQVSIPFIGPPFTPPYAKNYIKGFYSFDSNPRMGLYVNRGIGSSQLPYRFMNIPELTLFLISGE